ncbi:MAG TPA: hypothetical protein VFR64_01825 [Methylomirabilota bacterium]|nr:hypothetical protein [Methylomirabilota bacterium]
MPDYMLYVGTHAIDDPTRAGLVFAAARGAIGNGRQTKVALLGDAVLLMIPEIAANTHLAGPQRGSVRDLIDQLKKQPDQFEIHA